MKVGRIGRAAIAAAAMLGGAAVAMPAGGPRMMALSHVEPGQWQLREAGQSVPGRQICLSDPTVLLQLGHPGAVCQRLVLSDDPGGMVVHYTCHGAGSGRTIVSVETPRLLRVQTQGVASGAPFDLDYEARRIGACLPATH